MRFPSCVVALVVAVAPIPVAAQQFEPTPSKLIISERAIADGIAATPPPPPPGDDSLKNGTIIGALVGGLAAAAFLGYVCTVYKEPSDPPCWKSVAVPSLLGVGVGAAAGAGIDAMMVRSTRPFDTMLKELLTKTP